MAKCLMCGEKKGKRACHRMDGDVCSLCCGQTRNEDLCVPCEFYRSAKQQRRYSQAGRYGLDQMQSDMKLASIANSISERPE